MKDYTLSSAGGKKTKRRKVIERQDGKKNLIGFKAEKIRPVYRGQFRCTAYLAQ